MLTRSTVHRLSTVLFCIGIFPGAIMDIVQPPVAIEAMAILGLPLYVLTLIGIWKVLGVLALASFRWPTLREWAYAGFVIDLTGAAWCHAAVGDTLPSIVIPLVFLLPLGVSWTTRSAVQDGRSSASDPHTERIVHAG